MSKKVKKIDGKLVENGHISTAYPYTAFLYAKTLGISL